MWRQWRVFKKAIDMYVLLMFVTSLVLHSTPVVNSKSTGDTAEGKCGLDGFKLFYKVEEGFTSLCTVERFISHAVSLEYCADLACKVNANVITYQPITSYCVLRACANNDIRLTNYYGSWDVYVNPGLGGPAERVEPKDCGELWLNKLCPDGTCETPFNDIKCKSDRCSFGVECADGTCENGYTRTCAETPCLGYPENAAAFQCDRDAKNHTRCVPLSKRCDGNQDCNDGADEKDCGRRPTTTVSYTPMFPSFKSLSSSSKVTVAFTSGTLALMLIISLSVLWCGIKRDRRQYDPKISVDMPT